MKMRLTILALTGALGLAATAASAPAAPLAPALAAGPAPGVVQVWGGCRPGSHPVPGHWLRWRGAWIAPHCAPNYRPSADQAALAWPIAAARWASRRMRTQSPAAIASLGAIHEPPTIGTFGSAK